MPLAFVQVFAHPQQGIDHGIAGHGHVLQRHTFVQQVVASLVGGREMQVGDDAGQAPVGFFGPRRLEVAGAQPGLDVGDRDLPVEGGEGGDETGGGVAMHQDDIRLVAVVAVIELAQQLFGKTVEGLALGHDLQVFIDAQAKGSQHLFEHFPVLAGGTDHQIDFRPLPQNPRQGGHLDRFGTGAEYHHHFERHLLLLVSLQELSRVAKPQTGGASLRACTQPRLFSYSYLAPILLM
ncbi:hypothetical protein D9M71_198920 [compost metagenome]